MHKFCVYLGFEFVLNKAKIDLNSALGLIDWGKELSREHWGHSLVFQDSIKFLQGLIMYSCLKYLASPPIQMESFELKSRWKGTENWSEISTQIFEAKYYMTGPKTILMALYYIFLQTDKFIFPSPFVITLQK